MRYFLVEKQGGGCDYTIGCGLRISELPFAKSVEEAKAEAAKKIGDNWRANYEYGIEHAELLVVEDKIDLSDYLTKAAQKREADRKAEEAKDQEKAELETLARLAKKHGKSVR